MAFEIKSNGEHYVIDLDSIFEAKSAACGGNPFSLLLEDFEVAEVDAETTAHVMYAVMRGVEAGRNDSRKISSSESREEFVASFADVDEAIEAAKALQAPRDRYLADLGLTLGESRWDTHYVEVSCAVYEDGTDRLITRFGQPVWTERYGDHERFHEFPPTLDQMA